jgi:hypothetical protein
MAIFKNKPEFLNLNDILEISEDLIQEVKPVIINKNETPNVVPDTTNNQETTSKVKTIIFKNKKPKPFDYKGSDIPWIGAN